MNELMTMIESETFIAKGRGKLYSYISTESCLYVSEKVAIFKNYCFPVRNYPARGYTIISAEFGMIDIYEEKQPGIIKRDITISEFPEILLPYLTTPFPQMTVTGLNAMMEKVYHQFNPGCWSTNFSFYTERADANCTVNTNVVEGFAEWSDETQLIVLNEETWNQLYKRIDSKLKGN